MNTEISSLSDHEDKLWPQRHPNLEIQQHKVTKPKIFNTIELFRCIRTKSVYDKSKKRIYTNSYETQSRSATANGMAI